MNNQEIFSLVINNLGIVGFVIFLFFLLLAIYAKKSSERKMLIYVFSFLGICIVGFTFYIQNAELKTNANVLNTQQLIDKKENNKDLARTRQVIKGSIIKGSTVSLQVDGNPTAEQYIEHTVIDGSNVTVDKSSNEKGRN